MKYISNHEDEFTNPTVAFMIALMQLVGNLSAEIVNVIALTTRSNAIHCLEHFVAFEMLTNIDNIYFSALPVLPIMDQICRPILFKNLETNFMERRSKNKCFYIVFKFWSAFYVVAYYYLTPFVIIYIPFFFAFQGLSTKNAHLNTII